MDRGPSVAAVVLNRNRAADTLACLDSLAGQTHGNLVAVVVDNGSEPDELRRLADGVAPLEWVRLVVSPANLHFARGNNVGIDHAVACDPDYILLVNNDVVCAPDLVGTLLAELEAHPNVGVAGPRICRYDSPGTIETDGFDGWLSIVVPRPRGVGEGDGPAPPAGPTAYVTGCSMLVPARVVREVGAFEPAFWSYYEDWDWNLRIQAAGYESRHVPAARIWHKQAATVGHQSPAQYFLTSRGRVLLARRHLTRWRRLAAFWPATVAMNLLVSIRLFLTAPPAAARAVWQGTLWRPDRHDSHQPVAQPPEPGPEVRLVKDWGSRR